MDWADVRLSDFLDVKHGHAFEGKYFQDEATQDILLTPGNFRIGGGFKEDKFKFYDGPIPDEFTLQAGDIIVTMTDLSKTGDTLGYPAILPEGNGKRYLHNQRVGKLVFRNQRADPRFIYYVMCSAPYRHEILATATGSTVRHTAPSRIGAYRFRLPPLPVQRRIAAILGALDDKIELNGKMIETLEGLVRTIFKSWFIDFDPVHARREGKPPFGMDAATAALFPDDFETSELGEIPKGWSVRPFGDYMDTVSETFKFAEGQQVVFLNTSDLLNGEVLVQAYSDAAGLPGQAKKRIRSGDILFSEIRPANKRHALVDFDGSDYVVSTKLMVLRSKAIDPIYPYFVLTSPEITDHLQRLAESRSGTFPQITFDQVRPLKLCMPHEDVLTRFLAILRNHYEMVSHLRRETRSLHATRDLLLPRLLSGELPIKDAKA